MRRPLRPLGHPAGRDVERDDRDDDRHPQRGPRPRPARLGQAQDHLVHLLGESVPEDHDQMDGEEDPEQHQPDEVQAPRRLPAAEGPLVPGEPRQDRRRLRQPGQDLDRSQDEHEAEVGQLLQRVERRRAIRGAVGGRAEGGVHEEVAPGLRDHPPRGRDEPLPLRRDEQEHGVAQPGREPPERRDEVPVAAQAEPVAAGQGEPRRPFLLLVGRAPHPVSRHRLAREPEPFAPRLRVDVPVELRVRRQDRQAAAEQQREEQDVEPMGQSDPQRESQVGAVHGSLVGPGDAVGARQGDGRRAARRPGPFVVATQTRIGPARTAHSMANRVPAAPRGPGGLARDLHRDFEDPGRPKSRIDPRETPMMPDQPGPWQETHPWETLAVVASRARPFGLRRRPGQPVADGGRRDDGGAADVLAVQHGRRGRR